MLKLDISTTQYQFAHGKKPSGRGMWAFEIDGDLVWIQGIMTFAEAKHALKKKLIFQGVSGYVYAQAAT